MPALRAGQDDLELLGIVPARRRVDRLDRHTERLRHERSATQQPERMLWTESDVRYTYVRYGKCKWFRAMSSLTNELIYTGGVIFAAIYGLVRWYLPWLQGTESIDERRSTISEDLETKDFGKIGDVYAVDQIDYIEEKTGCFYRLLKLTPFRVFRGWTTLRVSLVDAVSRPYVWREDDFGEDFNSYLQNVRDEQYPDVEVIEPDMKEGAFSGSPFVRLRINSLDPTELTKVIEQIPKFHEFYFENYPGDGRFLNDRR